MINWIDHNKEYNPIRKHIKLGFKTVADTPGMIDAIVEDLKTKKFDEAKSRVLIFVRTRKQSEEMTADLNRCLKKNKLPYAGKADYYHAGLEGTGRAEKYESYKNGEIVILIATKAFGMGMDIKNIHFVFHLGPSSTFEDYLQEVGRAGRNETSFEAAGYSKSNPLQAKCLITQDDFNKIKDLQHKNEITWSQIEQVRTTIFNYISKFRVLKIEKENAFPLPLDLLKQDIEYDEVYDKDTVFRIILYWLEKLKRIKLGVYTPSQLPIKILQDNTDLIVTKTKEENEQLKSLLNLLLQIKGDKFEKSEIVMVDMQFLKDRLKLKTTTELFKVLFTAQRFKLIILERNIKLEITHIRTPELKSWRSNIKSPIIEATFDFATEILKITKPGDQVVLDDQELNSKIKTVIHSNLLPENIFWKEKNKKNDPVTKEGITEKLIEDFKNVRSKFAFKLINFLPRLKHKSHIEYEGEKAFVSQLIYNGHYSNDISLKELNAFKIDLIKLINHIRKENIKKDKKTFNIVDLINQLLIEEKGDDYFQKLIFISKGLGYLKGDGGDLVPMGIELFIHDLSKIDIENDTDLEYQKEFDESNKMKELRLLALKCLTDLKDDEHDNFIKGYFKCSSIKDLIQLLIENWKENHPDLVAFREEALKEAKEALNESQRKVYDANLNQNIQVIAGPGTGKTHTLTLRVARLIQEDKINPDNILILAYNRAVVIELKERLGKLFKQLGYSKLIQKLKIFTFHGFIKHVLGAELDDLDFDEWTPRFIQIMHNTPGTIGQRLGTIKYVFVDEFQDITSERMELLKFIANPEKTRICVIGDPNQSIYGYERANLGGPMSPQSYYDTFANIYKPKVLKLNINYRSYIEILTESERLLSRNNSRFKMPELLAYNKTSSANSPVEIIGFRNNRVDWKLKLQELLRINDDKGCYRQIAIMFRSNNEVYRAFNMLKDLNLNARLRVQGAKVALTKTREFYELLRVLKLKSQNQLTLNYLEEILVLKTTILREHPNWDQYILDVFHCLVYEFEKEKDEDSTYGDLIQFIEDIGRNDDGQFGKIYEQNIKEIGGDNSLQEVVITTMHKVKGLEFDAVLIPPSFSNLPTTSKFNEDDLLDYIEEERRLYYVAYSRAKRKLVVIKYDRETALEEGIRYTVPPNILNQLGIAVNEGIDKLTLYWSASNYGNGCFNFIKNNVSLGDTLVLRPIINDYGTFWYAFKNNQKVALLSHAFSNKISHLPEVNGFIVSSIYVHTYKESLISDKRNNTTYSNKWNEESKKRGYVYLIDFSGYGS
ncbi:UvrD-helicase domain-containing protein [Maribacter sp. MMG018]|uniref:UvrD-helicase domain-containing protein n=1 Tax=Maribacter sp. MMG018 TaxID=2822688 RepID=UPI001B39905E|nr:UvrD-helicase domain-containing protein [Maribacter sp. MMG018]MBQ4915279.1 UvrD-helicase domain-containing protein [Maribacter sp. MMG018]